MAEPETSVSEWARTAVRSGSSRRCRACAAPQDVREAINTVLRLHNSGESDVSMPQLSDFIASRWGVTLGKYTLQNHFRYHTPDRWIDRRG